MSSDDGALSTCTVVLVVVYAITISSDDEDSVAEDVWAVSSAGVGDNGGDGSHVGVESVNEGVYAIVTVAGCLSYEEVPGVPAYVGGCASASDFVVETLGRIMGPLVGEVGE